MSRRQRSAPKANISPSVRLGLTSIVAGNEAGIRTMLSAAASDDLVEKLAEPHVERGLPSSATARQPIPAEAARRLRTAPPLAARHRLQHARRSTAWA